MTSGNRLNKHLWTNITRLKLLAKGDEHVKFILEQNPFDDEEEEKVAAEKDEYIISGLVLPKAGIYKDNGFRIQMILTSRYPTEAPIVKLLTSVYHPNIEDNGTFCHQLLNNGSKWLKGATLADVVRVVVKYLNEPDPDYAVNFEMGKEYIERRDEYNRKALEMAQKNLKP